MMNENLPFIRLAQLRIEPTQLEAFKVAAYTLGQAAILLESGCLALYAVADQIEPSHFTVFEIYRDEAAYQIHLQSEHFIAFHFQTSGMVLERQLTTVTPMSLFNKLIVFNLSQ